MDLIRRFVVSGRFEHIATADDGELETREGQLLLESEFENSDQLSFFFNDNFELLTNPFTISPGVTLPTGGYNFQNFRASKEHWPGTVKTRATRVPSTTRETVMV